MPSSEQETDVIGRLLCWLGKHDWEDVESVELEAEYEEPVAIHYSQLFPLKWTCTPCGETDEVDFEQISLEDEDRGVMDTWRRDS